MPLFETTQVDVDSIREIVLKHWKINLGECIKSSQNQTFMASRGSDSSIERFIVRVTPDPEEKRRDGIHLELKFLSYLHDHQLQVCKSIPSQLDQSPMICQDSLIICVFEFATGEPVVFTDWKWMTEKSQVVALGQWFAKLHTLSRQFSKEHQDLALHARPWTVLHNGILSDVPVHEDDQKTCLDPEQFGIIHGDVNPSNYHWDPEIGMPCMFDWDQLQKGWFLSDLAQPIWTVITLKNGGNPIDFSPVPEANVEQFTEWLLEGYYLGGAKQVDSEALKRMISIKKELYARFCPKALLELPEDSPMAVFCRFMIEWLEKMD